MTPAKKFALVVTIQFLVLFSVIAFKQYTVWTGEAVLLRTAPVDPNDLLRGDYTELRYTISTIDLSQVLSDRRPYGSIYVELERADDGYWRAVAIHNDRKRSFDGTVLLQGKVERYSGANTVRIRYGIEQIFIPDGSGRDLPRGPGHSVAVEVKVDRFGNAVPRRFVVDGQHFRLHRR